MSEATVPLKIYSDRSHYERSIRRYLVSLLRPYWKDTPISEQTRIQTYGPHVQNFQVVENPEEADIFVLPFVWKYYYESKKLDQAVAFVEQAKLFAKPVITMNGGDYSVPIPVDDVYLFESNGYQSQRKPHQFAIPSFIKDPLPECGQTEITVRRKQARPIVGFCGQAKDSFLQKIGKPIDLLAKKIKFYTQLSYFEPQPIYPPTFLRAKILSRIGQSDKVETNFIKRERYSSINKQKGNYEERLDFLKNIQDSDYTVCVRGTGNYSLRFYEVLAMGRIPIFINTDCILPYDQAIDWKEYCVWVEQDELDQLPQKIVDFHEALDQDLFADLQRKCRQLWLERLSLNGFFAHFAEHLQTCNSLKYK